MEPYFTLYKTHSIHIDADGITIDDFYYKIQNSIQSLSEIEQIYGFPDGYLKRLVDSCF